METPAVGGGLGVVEVAVAESTGGGGGQAQVAMVAVVVAVVSSAGTMEVAALEAAPTAAVEVAEAAKVAVKVAAAMALVATAAVAKVAVGHSHQREQEGEVAVGMAVETVEEVVVEMAVAQALSIGQNDRIVNARYGRFGYGMHGAVVPASIESGGVPVTWLRSSGSIHEVEPTATDAIQCATAAGCNIGSSVPAGRGTPCRGKPPCRKRRWIGHIETTEDAIVCSRVHERARDCELRTVNALLSVGSQQQGWESEAGAPASPPFLGVSSKVSGVKAKTEGEDGSSTLIATTWPKLFERNKSSRSPRYRKAVSPFTTTDTGSLKAVPANSPSMLRPAISLTRQTARMIRLEHICENSSRGQKAAGTRIQRYPDIAWGNAEEFARPDIRNSCLETLREKSSAWGRSRVAIILHVLCQHGKKPCRRGSCARPCVRC